MVSTLKPVHGEPLPDWAARLEARVPSEGGLVRRAAETALTSERAWAAFSTAEILCNLRLDAETVAAAVLHVAGCPVERINESFGPDIARIIAGVKTATDEFIETELLGPRYFNGSIQRRSDGDFRHHIGDIVRR